jgi:hypothetical protein
MKTNLLTEKYADDMYGVLNGYDRILITGHVRQWCYAKAMTSYLYQHNIRIFDYSEFVKPLRERIRTHAERIAKENGLEIEFVRRSKRFRKEKRIKKILKERGNHPGLVHIFSAMESCSAYVPWHDKAIGKTFVKSTSGKCLHYYFYFSATPHLNYILVTLAASDLAVPKWYAGEFARVGSGKSDIRGKTAKPRKFGKLSSSPCPVEIIKKSIL